MEIQGPKTIKGPMKKEFNNMLCGNDFTIQSPGRQLVRPAHPRIPHDAATHINSIQF
jgi:hypothetical protein